MSLRIQLVFVKFGKSPSEDNYDKRGLMTINIAWLKMAIFVRTANVSTDLPTTQFNES